MINGWFLIPYIQKVTDKLKNIANSMKAKLSFFSLNKLGTIIKAQKDTLSPGFNKNIVYKLCLVRIVMLHMSDKRKENSTQEYQNIEETLIRKLASIL